MNSPWNKLNSLDGSRSLLARKFCVIKVRHYDLKDGKYKFVNHFFINKNLELFNQELSCLIKEDEF